MKVIALPALFMGLMGCEQESAAPVNALTDQEQADLIFMHEEEKLARDAYLHLASVWAVDSATSRAVKLCFWPVLTFFYIFAIERHSVSSRFREKASLTYGCPEPCSDFYVTG